MFKVNNEVNNIVNFEYILHPALAFLLLNLNIADWDEIIELL